GRSNHCPDSAGSNGLVTTYLMSCRPDTSLDSSGSPESFQERNASNGGIAMKTVVSLYDNIEDARDVVEDLVDAGLNREDISLVARDVEGQYGTYLEEGYAEGGGEEVGEAAAGGAL